MDLRVLVIEDNQDVADALAMLLEARGCRVDVVYDGTAALECARCCEPDVVFADIGLPGIDGFEVARRLRTTPYGQKAYLVALTGYGQNADREAALSAGFDQHLTKPVKMDTLVEILDARER